MQTILEIGLSNAVIATLLAVLALIVTRLWRGPALSHALWLLVLVKLITPPLVHISIPWFVQPGTTASNTAKPSPEAPTETVVLGYPVDIGMDLWNEQQSPAIESAQAVLPAFVPSEKAKPDSLPSESTPEGSKALAWLSWDAAWTAPLIGSIWLAGSGLCMAVAGLRIRRFHRLLDYAQAAPPSMQMEARAIARRLGLSQCPSVWLASGRFSPLLWAVGGKARLILPAGLLNCLGPDQQATLLAHELAHARRHDHWVRWLELAVTCLYWWHPVAWWARRELRLAEEQCCDAWVVWALPDAARAYAKALLQTVDFLDARPALPPVASGIGHVHHLKRRLKMIIRNPFYPRLAWPAYLAVILLGLAVLPLGTDRLFGQSPAREKDDQPSIRRDDLEHRLQQLEERMDKVLRALESRGEQPRQEHKPRKDDGEKQEKRKIKIRKEEDKEAKSDTKPGKEKLDGKKKEERRVEVRIEHLDPQKLKELERRIEEAVNRATDPEKIKVLKKRIEESVHRAADPEKMKELQKRIEVILDKNLDPERMKKLEKDIEESVRRNFDPERMKEFQKQIEEAVKKGVDPERMKQMGKEIEESVRRSIEEITREAEHAKRAAVDQAKAARDAEQAAREQERKLRTEERERERAKRAERTSRARPEKTERPDRDLERRIQKLEERMDRILKRLESSREQEEKEEP
jgi:bla regulator protein blaR1